MWGRLAISAAALVLLSGAGGGSPRVTQLNRATTSVYDENMQYQGRQVSWKLPEGGAPIIDVTHKTFVGIKRNSETIYVRLAEVTTADLPGPCIVTAAGAAGAGKAHIAGSTGFGSSMGNASKDCIPQ